MKDTILQAMHEYLPDSDTNFVSWDKDGQMVTLDGRWNFGELAEAIERKIADSK